MKLLSALIGLALIGFATSASAHVVAITTSITAASGSSEAEIDEALNAAITDALDHALGFTPTMVTVRDVRRLGDRIYFVLLAVDRDGEAFLRQLEADDVGSSAENATTL